MRLVVLTVAALAPLALAAPEEVEKRQATDGGRVGSL